MTLHLTELIVLTLIVHLIDTLAYSVRLNSVKSGKFALSISLFNIFVLVSRTANMFQAPLIGGLIGISILKHHDPLSDIRLVILAATIGTLIGIVFIPTFLKLFSKAVDKLEVKGSVPSIVVEALSVNNMKRIVKSTTRPRKRMVSRLRFREIPKRFLILNTMITAIYTIGVVSAYYAAFFVDDKYRLAASASSGMINGVATILLTLLVDPQSAIITDQAMRSKRPYGDVKALVIMLIGTKLLGTLIGQLLIYPAAQIIASFYH
ncbi:lipid II flippase Amj family protein [Neobacillus sp. PS3-34]|uniref:lipid II flippase Amj family protein n=1 Tax=Neobacillus sp. PS3-34 TaxID=3070678 RepID=UPI0027DFA207|nr:lipid II flippase Amj family protein [Neobacillus sp. PS3-34]WML46622.1 lipid II flippase Amj family protein [Neobacillus sp. PS3-34]